MKQYIEHIDGDINIVISVPHGGIEKPDSIPDRTCQCLDKGHEKCPVVSVSDEFTIDLANVVSESIEKNLKKKPHLVINHLNRTKLDPNRVIEIAAQTEDSKEAFKMYHGLIKSTTSKFKRGLLIDLHGRSKKDSITQLGYNIKKKQLLDNDFKKTELSIGTLAKENPEIDFLTGEFSFGDFMEKEGYTSVPSPSLPKPDGNEVYFPGGYITKTYGNTHFDAIQLETPSDLRMDSKGKRIMFGMALGKIISNFYKCHYTY